MTNRQEQTMSEVDESAIPGGSWRSRAWGLGIILLACVAVRAPSLDESCLNPDEAQYAAFASYLNSRDWTAFDQPILHVYTHAIYQGAAKIFGDYEMLPLRVISGLLCYATTALIFLLVLPELGFILALVSSLLFIYLSCYFEGLSANREWFCLVPIMASAFIYLRANNWPSSTRLFAAGFVVTIAAWFKEQAIPLVVVYALDIVVRSFADRNPKRMVRECAALLAGVAASQFCFSLPMILKGTLHQQIDWILRIQVPFALRGESDRLQSPLAFYFNHFYLGLPFRRLFLAAYARATFALPPFVRSVITGEHDKSSRLLMLATYALIVSMALIQIGQRMFLHYYLFMIPWIAILFSYGLRTLLDWKTPTKGGILAVTAFAAALFYDAIFMRSEYPFQSMEVAMSNRGEAILLGGVAILFTLTLGMIALLARRWHWPWKLLRTLVVLVLAVDSMKLIGETHVLPLALQRGASFYQSPALIDYLRSHSTPGDLLFVWGWRPEIYSESQIPAATSFESSLELASDPNHALTTSPAFDAFYMDQLIKELSARPPRYIVDAWLQSIFGSSFRIDYYPPFKEFLEKNYFYETTIEAQDVYRRKGPDEAGQPSARPTIRQSLEFLTQVIDTRPRDAILRFNKADILAQEGSYRAARRIYLKILEENPDWTIVEQRLATLDAWESNRSQKNSAETP